MAKKGKNKTDIAVIIIWKEIYSWNGYDTVNFDNINDTEEQLKGTSTTNDCL